MKKETIDYLREKNSISSDVSDNEIFYAYSDTLAEASANLDIEIKKAGDSLAPYIDKIMGLISEQINKRIDKDFKKCE